MCYPFSTHSFLPSSMDLAMPAYFVHSAIIFSLSLSIIFPMITMHEKVHAAPASPASPTADTQIQGGVLDFEVVKDQGLLYFRNKIWKAAREQFDLAYSSPQGKSDFIVIFYRGTLAEKGLELEIAFEMAQRAIELAEPGSKDKQNAQQLFDRLNGKFAYVSIVAAKEETNAKGRVYLESKRRILNKQKREQFTSIRERFRNNDVALPTKIYLPYGSYTANNVPFKISSNADQAPKVAVFLHIIKKKVKKESRTLLYTSIGILSAAVIGFGTYFLLNPEEPESKPRLKLEFTPIFQESK
jgi:hypothetical protein